MTKLKLLSAALIAAGMLATPAMARTSHVTSRHLAQDANASASPTARFIDGRVCIPAPRVGAFATAPWGGDNVPCEPDPVHERRAPGLAFRAVLGRSINRFEANRRTPLLISAAWKAAGGKCSRHNSRVFNKIRQKAVVPVKSTFDRCGHH